MLLLSPENWNDYALIDSGGFEKLERFGGYVLARPEPKAVWGKTLPPEEWQRQMHTSYTAGAGFGKAGKEDSGAWNRLKTMPGQWIIHYRKGALQFRLRLGLTAFKHVGVFPEQAPNWDYIYTAVRALETPQPKILNLFAYTGAASLAARAAGGDVTHLDAVRQVVTWARDNMETSGQGGIRWVVEDALKFVRREAKRGNRYRGIILDPPAYGHGPAGEKWKLDECLLDILQECKKILAPQDSFFVLNLYSNGFSALVADTIVTNVFGKTRDKEFGELFLCDAFGKRLPLSVFTRFKL
ncbi:MAG: class I SAM-dependent methyltransferase [Prevotellaceae bacterium]|jgi:23S rRNA (cytosine1962-C5)-methyltransferase|nr:class I SAM-dependent methyltransferase [Prevotellaceae bacterium]